MFCRSAINFVYTKDTLKGTYNMTPMLETAIKFYHVNKDSDIAVYMVFNSLAEEKVYFPTNSKGHLLSLSLGAEEMIPLFTSEDKVNSDEPIQLRADYVKHYISALLKAGKHLIINPFSEEDIKFIIPYEAIERMLIPVLLKHKNKV